MKLLIVFTLFSVFISCRKDTSGDIYTIEGQILESSSNPIPIKNYALNFYQSYTSGLLGGLEGIDQTIKTDNNGNFLLKYDPSKNYGMTSGGTNDNSISIYGMDTFQFNGFHPIWAPVPPSINFNLGKLYLFKKIDKVIRKVRFSNSLNPGESLELITTNGSAANYSTLVGPILSGTFLTVDTIQNCRLELFNLTNKTYSLSVTLKKTQFHKDTTYVLTVGDESQREVQIVY